MASPFGFGDSAANEERYEISTIAQPDGAVDGERANNFLENLGPDELAQLQLILQQQNKMKIEEDNKTYMGRLRSELNRLNSIEAQNAARRGIALNSAIKLPATKMLFHTIDGFIFLSSLASKSEGNPLKMVHHLEATLDPIAWFSFYTFMISQGYYIDFKTKHLSPELKAQAMQNLMYKGLVLGSFASTFTADVLTLFKDCTLKRFSNAPSEKIDEACGEALKQWTVTKKFNQYGTQILTLIAGQIISDAIEKDIVKKAASSKLAKSSISKIGSGILKTTNNLRKLVGADVIIQITPSGFTIKAVHWLLQTAQIVNFLAVDHIISHEVNRIGGNLTQAFSFRFNAKNIEESASWLSENKWNFDTVSATKLGFKNSRPQKLGKEILEYTDNMNAWRLHLNSKNEEDIQLWIQTNADLIHQLIYSRDFYKKFSEQISTQNDYPRIILPLFGVATGKENDQVKDADQYILRPAIVEKYQHERLISLSQEYGLLIKQQNLDAEDKNVLLKLMSALASTDVKVQGQALAKINIFLRRYRIDSSVQASLKTPEAENILAALVKRIGNPYPIFEPGLAFSYAYSINEANAVIDKSAHFPISSSFHYFHNTPVYLMYRMFCGPLITQISENNTDAFAFKWPRITHQDNSTNPLCSLGTSTFQVPTKNGTNVFTTDLLFNAEINGKKFIESLSDPENLQDSFANRKSPQGFQSWWAAQEAAALKIFGKLDSRLKVLIDRTHNNFVEARSYGDFAIDFYTNWSSYLPTSIKASLVGELKTYIALLRSYQSGNSSTKLSPEFIKNIKSATDDPAYAIEKPSIVGQTFYEIKKDMLKMDFPIEFIDKLNNAREAQKKQPYKNSEDMIKQQNQYIEIFSLLYLKGQYLQSLIQSQKHLSQQVEEHNELSAVVFANDQFMKSVTDQNKLDKFFVEVKKKLETMTLNADFLKSAQYPDKISYLKSLKNLNAMQNSLKARIKLLEENFNKNTLYKKVQIEKIQLQASLDKLEKINIELLESAYIDLVELFHKAKTDRAEVQIKQKTIELLLTKLFGEEEDVEKLKNEKSAEAQFIYALYKGFKSVQMSASRFATLRTTLSQQYFMAFEEVESFSKVQQNNKSNIQNARGFKPGGS